MGTNNNDNKPTSLYTILLCLGCLLLWGTGQVAGQLTTTHTQDSTALMRMITGPGVVSWNASLSQPYDSTAGFFVGTASNIGLDSGIVLGTGSIYLGEGPNDDCCAGQGIGPPYNPGDPLLDVIAGTNTTDATLLEFDLVASCDTIGIRFVFGSEEYPEFTCNQYNDAFGFFIDGPGYTGPTNIALIPGTTTPITINTVHDGSNGSPYFPCPAINANYYVNNGDGTTPAANPSVQYDGFTTVIDVRTWVQPCDTYRISFRIADGFDDVWDSGIFIEAGGLRCTNSQVSLRASSAISGGSNIMVEGCANGLFSLLRTGDLTNPLTVGLATAGTATMGSDFNNLPTTLTFPSGVDSLGIPVTAIGDAANEGLESLFLILQDTVCAIPVQDTALLFISDPPIAGFVPSDGCVGNPVTFTDNSFFPAGNLNDFQWNFGDGNTGSGASVQHIYTAPGTYTVSLTVSNPQGCTDNISQTIEIFPSPTADFSMSGVCVGLPTLFTDLSAPEPGGTLTAWTWNLGGIIDTQQNPTRTFTNPGTYTIRLIVENANGCQDTLEQPLVIPDETQMSFSFADACAEEVVSFTDNSVPPTGGTISSRVWDFGDGSTAVSANPSHAYTNPGTYTVTLTSTNSFGCEYTTTDDIVIHPNPVPVFSAAPVCIGLTTEFVEASTLSSGSILSWDWDFDDGNGSTDREPTHTYDSPGIYNVTLTVTSDQGCVRELTLPIEVFEVPFPPIPVNDSVCKGEIAELEVQTGGPVEIYWHYDPASPNWFNQGQFYTTLPVISRQVYYVRTISDDGCISDFLPIVAFPYRRPSVEVFPSRRELEVPLAIVEFRTTTNIRMASWYWEFGDGTTSTVDNPVHQYTQPGTYDVFLRVVDENGCVREYFFPEYIIVTEEINLFIPSAFTPNGDGLNDEFWISTQLISRAEIAIYDRWGREVFNSSDMNFRWDGTDKNGTVLPEGVYTYKLNATDYQGRPHVKAGTVTLIR
jgi:gliding motility-associated-like protein